MDDVTACVDVQVYVYVALQRSHAAPQRGLGGLLDGPRPWRVLRQQRLELRVQVLRLHAAAESFRIVKLRAARAVVVRRPLPDLFRYTTRIDLQPAYFQRRIQKISACVCRAADAVEEHA